jgi:hypothetical protein
LPGLMPAAQASDAMLIPAGPAPITIMSYMEQIRSVPGAIIELLI